MHDKFFKLFGITQDQIQANCLVMPLVPKGVLSYFKITKLERGLIYASANTQGFSLICTGMGAALSADAVLYLKDSACKQVLLLGSCGGVDTRLKLGELVLPKVCFSQESFSSLLEKRSGWNDRYNADKQLLAQLTQIVPAKQVTCATLGSLKLEEQMQADFTAHNIEVVDMELSSFLAAAKYSGIKAAALFYVSDILGIKPFYGKFSAQEQQQLDAGIKKASEAIWQYYKE